jgi:hypothetical protein
VNRYPARASIVDQRQEHPTINHGPAVDARRLPTDGVRLERQGVATGQARSRGLHVDAIGGVVERPGIGAVVAELDHLHRPPLAGVGPDTGREDRLGLSAASPRPAPTIVTIQRRMTSSFAAPIVPDGALGIV